MVTIGFNPATYSVREDAGSVSVTLSVQDETLDRDVIVTMTTMNGTAMRESQKELIIIPLSLLAFLISPAGMQYTHVPANIIFNADISTQMVTIPILDNIIVADPMSFSVVLTSADSAVVLHPATADVTIEDDDSE